MNMMTIFRTAAVSVALPILLAQPAASAKDAQPVVKEISETTR
jgi:hypothetical protein